MWTMGKSLDQPPAADTNRWDVFSSARNRSCFGFSVTRSGDLVGEGLGMRQRALDEHARPAEMVRRPFYGYGFLMHGEDFPYGHTMPG